MITAGYMFGFDEMNNEFICFYCDDVTAKNEIYKKKYFSNAVHSVDDVKQHNDCYTSSTC